MKTIASFNNGYASRVLLFLVAAFSCVAVATAGGMVTGCGGSDQAAAVDDGGDDSGGSTPVAVGAEPGFASGAVVSAKDLIIDFDEDMEGVLDESYASLADADGNAVSFAFQWITPRQLRILAALAYQGEFEFVLSSAPLASASAAMGAAKADAAAELLRVSFSTGENPMDADGDGKADEAYHHMRYGYLYGGKTLAYTTKALLDVDVMGAEQDRNLSETGGSWAWILNNGDGEVLKPVALIEDVTGDGLADLVTGSEEAGVDDHGDPEQKHTINIWSSSGGSLEKVAKFAQMKIDGGSKVGDVFAVDLDGLPEGETENVKDLGLWLYAPGDEAISIAAIRVHDTVAAAGDALPASLTMPDLVAMVKVAIAADDIPLAVINAGDLNDDGKEDIAVAIETVAGDDEVRIYFGGWTGYAPDPDVKIEGTSHFGFALAGNGDVNGDRVDDLVIGEPAIKAANGLGRVLVFYGGAALAEKVLWGSITSEDADVVIAPTGDDFLRFGSSVALADVGGLPQFDDIIVGDPGQGKVFVFETAEDLASSSPLDEGDIAQELQSFLMGEGVRGTDGKLSYAAVGYNGEVTFSEMGRAVSAAHFANSGWADIVAAGGADQWQAGAAVETEDCSNGKALCSMPPGKYFDQVACLSDCATWNAGHPLAQIDCATECAFSCPAGFDEVTSDTGTLYCAAFMKLAECTAAAAANPDFGFTAGADPKMYDCTVTSTTSYERVDSDFPADNSVYSCVFEGLAEDAVLNCSSQGWLVRDAYREILDRFSDWWSDWAFDGV